MTREWPTDIPVHPAAMLFPLLEDSELAELAEDIRRNGLAQAIMLDHQDRVLDGRNRYLACRQVEVEPRYETYTGTDAWTYVISTNVHRRHLTDTQRNLIVAKIAERSRGSNRFQAKVDPPIGGSTPDGDVPPTQSEAARLLNVSYGGSTSRARAVTKEATETLYRAVEEGHLALWAASNVVQTCSSAEQDDIAKRVTAGESIRSIRAQESAQERTMDVSSSQPTRPILTESNPEPSTERSANSRKELDNPLELRARRSRESHVADRYVLARVGQTAGNQEFTLSKLTEIGADVPQSEVDDADANLTAGIRAFTRFRKIIREHQKGYQSR